MNGTINLATHNLPLWFLLVALVLPRLAMAVMWLEGLLVPFHLQPLIGILFWALLPRALVLYLIYLDQGVSGWFLIHLVVGIMVWLGGGNEVRRRRRRRNDF